MQKKRARYGSGSIYLRGKIYWLSWHEPLIAGGSVKKYASTGSEDRSVAERQMRAKLQTVGGRRPTHTDPDKVTYEEIRDNLLAYYVAKGRRSLKRNSGSGDVTLAVLPRLDKAFSGFRASQIDVPDLNHFRIEGRKDGLSDARINRYIACIRVMFKRALKDGLLTSDKVPQYFPMVHEPNEARGAIYFKREWYDKLLKILPEPIRSALMLAYSRGVRVSEIERLTSRDFDIKARVLTIPAAAAKTAKSRVISLPKDLKLECGAPDALVFPLGNYYRAWRKACVQVGAGRFEKLATGRKTYVGVLLRHCRHTFARNASDAGLEDRRIMDVTGHKTRSMLDRYNIGKETDARTSGTVVDRFLRNQL
jgi:integrase